MMVKYRELTEEEEKAFYETPEGKVALKEQEEERAFLETPEGKAILEKQEEERAYPVSYTHLTLPTTPYV